MANNSPGLTPPCAWRTPADDLKASEDRCRTTTRLISFRASSRGSTAYRYRLGDSMTRNFVDPCAVTLEVILPPTAIELHLKISALCLLRQQCLREIHQRPNTGSIGRGIQRRTSVPFGSRDGRLIRD